jgi:hypothetical protein
VVLESESLENAGNMFLKLKGKTGRYFKLASFERPKVKSREHNNGFIALIPGVSQGFSTEECKRVSVVSFNVSDNKLRLSVACQMHPANIFADETEN